MYLYGYNNAVDNNLYLLDVLVNPGAQAFGQHSPSFLKLLLIATLVCACLSPPPRLLITSGMIWTPYD